MLSPSESADGSLARLWLWFLVELVPQKAAPHTARGDVKSAGLARRHEGASGGGHAGILTVWPADRYQISLSLD